MRVEWNEKTMGTSIASVDEQHRELISMLNELIDAIEREELGSRLSDMVTFLAAYTREHFSHEEELMRFCDCQAEEENRYQHEEFILALGKTLHRLEEEGATHQLAEDIKQNLLDWFVNHIEGVDSQLKTCATGQRA